MSFKKEENKVIMKLTVLIRSWKIKKIEGN